jgi:acetyl-CoA carboxylase carboxyltransferase component
MSWQDEIDELARRRRLAEEMGGPEGVARQHERGKLTVRERIDALADPGTFQEFGGLVGSAEYEDNRLAGFIPKPLVEGYCRIDGRKVVVTGSDFTVRGGSGPRTSEHESGGCPTFASSTLPAAASDPSRSSAAPTCRTVTSGPRSTSSC